MVQRLSCTLACLQTSDRTRDLCIGRGFLNAGPPGKSLLVIINPWSHVFKAELTEPRKFRGDPRGQLDLGETVSGLSWALSSHCLPRFPWPWKEVSFSLLFICLSFTYVEVSAEKSALPVNGSNILPPWVGSHSCKVNIDQDNEGGGGSGEPTAHSAPWQARAPWG